MRTPQMLSVDLSVRAPGLNDLEVVIDLINACELLDLGEQFSTVEDLRSDWQSPGVCLETDAWLVVSPGGDVAGYALLFNPAVARFYIDAQVHPKLRGRGVEAQLFRLAETRARQQLQKASPGEQADLYHTFSSANEITRQAMEQEEFTLARRVWRMQIDMPETPAAPELPDGITVRSFMPDQDDRATFDAMEEAFRDHWGYTPWRFDFWRQRGPGREDFDPTVWFLAIDGDEIAGGALCHDYPNEGWVNQLGVRRPWRQRGLGLALLRYAFCEFYRRGQPRVGLGVDSQNTTGATRLYERAGMHVAQQFDSYHKTLR